MKTQKKYFQWLHDLWIENKYAMEKAHHFSLSFTLLELILVDWT